MTNTTVRRSLFFSFSDKYVVFIIQLLASMIVARLITPEQFGVFAIAFSIVGFTQPIRDMGTNSYIIHKTSLVGSDVQACLFIGFVVAITLSVLLLSGSGIVERLYGRDVLCAVFILIFNLFLMPISSTIFAVLQREMRFDLLLRVNIAGAIANAGCAISLAASGWGAMSLAWACVAGQLASAMAAAWCRPHREHFLPSYVGAKEVFRFGSVVMLGTLLSQISTNIANLITARFVTLEAMGLLSRSQSVSGLFGKLIMDGIQPLLLPLFANIKRENIALRPSVERLFSYVSVVSWPFLGFLAMSAKPIILFMFGEQWHGAAYLLIPISIGGMFWVFACILQPVLLALGRPDVTLRIQTINQAIAIVGVVLAAAHGIEAVAIAAIPISAIHGYTWWYCSARIVHIHAGAVFREAFLSGAVTVLSLAPPLLINVFSRDSGLLLQLAFCAATAMAGWIAAVFLCRHPISIEILQIAVQAKKSAHAWLRA